MRRSSKPASQNSLASPPLAQVEPPRSIGELRRASLVSRSGSISMPGQQQPMVVNIEIADGPGQRSPGALSPERARGVSRGPASAGSLDPRTMQRSAGPGNQGEIMDRMLALEREKQELQSKLSQYEGRLKPPGSPAGSGSEYSGLSSGSEYSHSPGPGGHKKEKTGFLSRIFGGGSGGHKHGQGHGKGKEPAESPQSFSRASSHPPSSAPPPSTGPGTAGTTRGPTPASRSFHWGGGDEEGSSEAPPRAPAAVTAKPWVSSAEVDKYRREIARHLPAGMQPMDVGYAFREANNLPHQPELAIANAAAAAATMARGNRDADPAAIAAAIAESAVPSSGMLKGPVPTLSIGDLMRARPTIAAGAAPATAAAPVARPASQQSIPAPGAGRPALQPPSQQPQPQRSSPQHQPQPQPQMQPQAVRQQPSPAAPPQPQSVARPLAPPAPAPFSASPPARPSSEAAPAPASAPPAPAPLKPPAAPAAPASRRCRPSRRRLLWASLSPQVPGPRHPAGPFRRPRPPAGSLGRRPAAPAPPGPGGIPAPPPPPPALGGGGAANPAVPAPKRGPSKNLRRVHWDRIPRDRLQYTIFAHAPFHQDPIYIDPAEVDVHFEVTKTQSRGVGRRESVTGGSAKTNIIAEKKAQRIGIVLSRFKQFSRPELSIDIVKAILRFDDSDFGETLDDRASTMQALIREWPTAEEEKRLLEHEGEMRALERPDAFYRAALGVPRMKEKIACFLYLATFVTELATMRAGAHLVTSACHEVMQSGRLARLFELVLAYGNYLNRGTDKGNTQGFKVTTLPKLVEAKAVNASRGVKSLLHLVALVCRRDMPLVAAVREELPSLADAVRVPVQTLGEQEQAMTKGLADLREEAAACATDADADMSWDVSGLAQSFRQQLVEFVPAFEDQLEAVAAELKQMRESLAGLSRFLGEDERATLDETMGVLNTFLTQFETCVEELGKAEAERAAKAQRAAQRGGEVEVDNIEHLIAEKRHAQAVAGEPDAVALALEYQTLMAQLLPTPQDPMSAVGAGLPGAAKSKGTASKGKTAVKLCDECDPNLCDRCRKNLQSTKDRLEELKEQVARAGPGGGGPPPAPGGPPLRPSPPPRGRAARPAPAPAAPPPFALGLPGGPTPAAPRAPPPPPAPTAGAAPPAPAGGGSLADQLAAARARKAKA
eukprot:tig00021522_g22113.t1